MACSLGLELLTNRGAEVENFMQDAGSAPWGFAYFSGRVDLEPV